jgi:hypothetical protein
MMSGLPSYFAERVPVVAAEQERLYAALNKQHRLFRGRKGAGRRPDPYLFLGSDRPVARRGHQVVADHFAVPRFIPAEFRPLLGQAKEVRSATSDGIARLDAALGMAKDIGALVWIRQVVRLVVLFRGGKLNSFYHPRAHGAVFIRLNRRCDDLHVFEELIHQSCHAFFSILLCREPPLVRNQRSSLTAAFDKGRDKRNVLVALHGLVTEAVISDALFRLATLRHAVQPAVIGRLAFCLAKFGSDLNAAMRARRLLTNRGMLWLAAMARTYDSIVKNLGPELLRVDLSGQPYVFDPELFRRRNAWLATSHS